MAKEAGNGMNASYQPSVEGLSIQAILESEEQLNTLFESTSEGILIADAETTSLLYANNAISQFLGYTMSELLQMSVHDIHPREHLELVIEAFQAQISGDVSIAPNIPCLTKDNTVVYADIKGSRVVIRDKVCNVGFFTDVTEKKISEDRLAELRETLVSLGPDYMDNINRLTALCGELLDGTCSLYNRLNGDLLCSLGTWHTPTDYNPVDDPNGHICFDIIRDGKPDIVLERNLQQSPYAKTDRNVQAYGLQTYIGKAVKANDIPVGALCVVYQRDFEPSDSEINLLEIIAQAISVEENRKAVDDALRTSEQQYRTLFENSGDAIFIFEMGGTVLKANSKACDLLGSSEQSFADGLVNIRSFTPAEVYSRFINTICDQKSTLEEIVFTRPDGTAKPTEISSKLIDYNGCQAILCTVRDITDRKRAEDYFKKIFDNTQDAIFIHDLNGRIIDVNNRMCVMYGLNKEEACSMGIEDVSGSRMDIRIAQAYWVRVLNGEAVQFDWEALRPKTNEVFNVEVALRRLDFTSDSLIIANVRDVTTQRISTELKQQQVTFLENLETINSAILQAKDVDEMTSMAVKAVYNIFACDRAWLLYPCDPDAETFRVPVECNHPDYPGAHARDLDVPMKPGGDEVCRMALDANDPLTFGPTGDLPLYKEVTEQFGVQSQMVMAIHPKLGKPWLFGLHQCSHAREWTEQDRKLFKAISGRVGDSLSSLLILRDLRKNEESIRTLISNIPGVTYRCACDKDWTVDFISSEIEHLSGYPATDFLNNNHRTYASIIFEQDRFYVYEAVNKAVEHREPYSLEYRITNADGELRWVYERGQGVFNEQGDLSHLDGVIIDITDRIQAEDEKHRLQEQLLHAQKLESIGRLAGGVAHDFNNMLQSILGNVEYAIDITTPTHALYENLVEIRNAATRSADLTRQLLAFARKQAISPLPLNLNNAIESMLKMLKRLIGEDIELLWKPDPDLWCINMDPSQFDQVIANLTVNARDAIDGIGSLTIETHNCFINEGLRLTHGKLPPGEFVCLTVGDTGCGLDATALDNLFEPFYTTKGVGEGTGLGLATVYGVVKQNKGFINVDSQTGKGTTFTLYFPKTHEPHLDEAPEYVSDLATGSETILIVEDEVAILKLSKKILEPLGYEVLTANQPLAALDIAANHDGPIHLLITDVVMPGMNGMTLSGKLTSLRPGLRVMFMSGYTTDIISHHGILPQDISFLQKPFTRESLAKRVRELLDN